MKIKNLNKNSRLTDFEVIKEIVISHSIKKMKKNSKKQEEPEEKLLSEF
ncbi:hypothetical protein KY304_00715 [Candidatus Woesearchaeota archaeon]|nr:hypothetical protein [Candidatus Woesearchaeota archaeon]MBW2978615.1 hypothetical protein [Candidatus Woesearchaeota archaeon]